MRLFVGVELSDAARRLAAEVARALQRELEKALGARWVAPQNMHLTVRFVGYVPDDRAAAVLEALMRPLDVPAFEIELGGCGRFPSRGAPRVLWIGVRTGLASLRTLHEEFNRRLAPIGYEPESRPFSAHLTLARIARARPAAASAI